MARQAIVYRSLPWFILALLMLCQGLTDGQASIPAVVNLNQKSGAVASPYYPSSVAANSKYRWIVSVPDARSITFRFEDFDVQDLTSSSCAKNYVVFYDASRQAAPTTICNANYARSYSEAGVTRFCNRKMPSQAVTLQSSLVVMEYCAPPRPGRGFRLFFQEDLMGPPIAPTVRPGIVTGAPGVLPQGIQCSMDPSQANYCGCGKSAIRPDSSRIVGGKEAKPHTWPWVVHLRKLFNGQPYAICGATLISEWYIVTAAHCVDTNGVSDPAMYSVRVGEHSRAADEPAQEDYQVSQIIMHPNYQRWDNDNDIALVRVSKKVTMKNEVNIVCLPAAWSDPAPGSQATVVGWGETVTQELLKMIRSGGNGSASANPPGPTTTARPELHFPQAQKIITGQHTGSRNPSSTRASAPALMQVTLPIIARSVCQGNDYYGYQITDNMMCAGLAYGTMDACKGDSGGPLMANYDNRWTLIGVVSWGEGCAIAKKPGVYTDVGNYVTWIKANAGMT